MNFKLAFALGVIAEELSRLSSSLPSFILSEDGQELHIVRDDGSLTYQFLEDTMTANFVEV